MLSVIKGEKISLFSERSEWDHLSEFEDMISDSSDNDIAIEILEKPFMYTLVMFLSLERQNELGKSDLQQKRSSEEVHIIFSLTLR